MKVITTCYNNANPKEYEIIKADIKKEVDNCLKLNDYPNIVPLRKIMEFSFNDNQSAYLQLILFHKFCNQGNLSTYLNVIPNR